MGPSMSLSEVFLVVCVVMKHKPCRVCLVHLMSLASGFVQGSHVSAVRGPAPGQEGH